MRAAARGRWLGGLLLFGFVAACGERAEPSPSAGAPVVAAQHARFTVLGRWPGPPRLSFGFDHRDAPFPAAMVEALARSAFEVWESSKLVSFHHAAPGQTPDLLFAWRAPDHEGCPPFAVSEGIVAHAGPPRPPSFVHFDASATWSHRGEDGHSFLTTAIHEIGHVLGLGHSPDPAAVMYGQYDPRKSALNDSDLAALIALYLEGAPPRGYRCAPGDLYVSRSAGRGTTLIPGAAPPDCRDIAVVDIDGDGRDEIVTWSLPRAEQHDMMIYRFDDQLRLAATRGPIAGVMSPGREVVVDRRADDGGAIMLLLGADGRYQALLFDQNGLPRVPWPPPGEALELECGLADVDGDGVLDGKERRKRTTGRPREFLRGDLDGDGREDMIHVPGR